ncbi:glycosyltransferase family 4 protein [Roseovarius sp. A21]|uniref:Glycosyltransferase family 4 protein n=1 Tax=Roseovarius bejariae TaxID=2576383 RepID=A0A844CUF7_9RHOB|nr:glycosyltransferase family 4 protein [Roseovarius bejariae]MRU15669.1 glycosyltransferase family 4 protein [Roseovarius bejariae]
MACVRILITVNAAWNIWNFRRPLVESLLADGHRVTILAPKDDTVPKLQALGCSVRHLEMNAKGLNPLQDTKLLLRLRQHFRDLRPDVILSFTIKNNIFGAIAAKSTRIPFIPNVTGLGTAFLSGGFLEKVAGMLYKIAFRNLPIVFFQNEDDQTLFLERGLVTNSQARRLPGSGIDLDRFAAAASPAEDEAPIFLMIARLLRDKGVIEYVEAARRVKARHAQARFQLLGATDAVNRTAIDGQTVAGWEREGIIEYLGTVEDVRPMIEASHCVVLPSYREGAPRTLIEAAAMARPLIATDVPGCRAVVDDKTTGFLCEARSAESLAAACEAFISLPSEERAALGCAGRAKMEREYGQNIVLDAYRAALRDLGPATCHVAA